MTSYISIYTKQSTSPQLDIPRGITLMFASPRKLDRWWPDSKTLHTKHTFTSCLLLKINLWSTCLLMKHTSYQEPFSLILTVYTIDCQQTLMSLLLSITFMLGFYLCSTPPLVSSLGKTHTASHMHITLRDHTRAYNLCVYPWRYHACFQPWHL